MPKQTKTSQAFLCPAGWARPTQETQGEAETPGQRNNNNQTKQNITKTKQTQTLGDAADAEVQSSGVPST